MDINDNKPEDILLPGFVKQHELIDINNKKPEDVLGPEFVQQYQELHEDIWHRLAETNVNITILEKIQSFPFHHFYPPNENIFWTSVYWNFLYISIITIHTIINDQSADAHTLLRFKNNISREWLIDAEKQTYFQNLKEVKFDQTTENIRKKITDMRDLIAHRLFDEHGRLSNPEGVTVSEIRRLYAATEKVFRACSFGAEYVTTLYIEGTVGGKPIEKDIDHLLDLIVKDSYWLNEPEKNPQSWVLTRKHESIKHESIEEISELNKWRKKFGMPEVR